MAQNRQLIITIDFHWQREGKYPEPDAHEQLEQVIRSFLAQYHKLVVDGIHMHRNDHTPPRPSTNYHIAATDQYEE